MNDTVKNSIYCKYIETEHLKIFAVKGIGIMRHDQIANPNKAI